MINLYSNIFASGLIISSIVFLPLTFASFIFGCLEKHIFAVGCSIVLFLIYLLTVLYFYWRSKSSKYYLCRKNDSLSISIHSYFIKGGKETIETRVDSVVKIEYYSLFSPLAWLSLIDMQIMFGSAHITLMKDGNQVSYMLGYPKIKEVEDLCKETGIVLIKR